jgi:RNA polymerase sigma-70 factor, ECF subfamily
MPRPRRCASPLVKRRRRSSCSTVQPVVYSVAVDQEARAPTAQRPPQVRAVKSAEAGSNYLQIAVATSRHIVFLPGAAGERALVARMSAGEEPAFRECYEQQAAKVFRILVRIVGEHGRAEEVLQETFVAAFKRIGQFRGEARLGTWITGIAIHRALNLLRDESRRLPAVNGAEARQEPPPIAASFDPARRELALHVLELVAELEPPRRIALLLHAEGYTAAEIGEMTGAPRGTVLSHIHRAKAELVARLGPDAAAVVSGAAREHSRG